MLKKLSWVTVIIVAMVMSLFGCKADPIPVVEADFQINEETFVMVKEPKEEFRILNLTDVQLSDLETDDTFVYTFDTIRYLVATEKPHLITLTGDNVWQLAIDTLPRFIKFMDSLGVPWAPVLGNHDGESMPKKSAISEAFYKSENCVWHKGTVSGTGNYVINIVERAYKKTPAKLVYSLIMMDTNTKPEDNSGGYGHCRQDQIDWYKTVIAENNKIANGEVVPSAVLFHVPLVEYVRAYDEWVAGGQDPSIGFGEKREKQCPPNKNSGFFDVMKQSGSTTDVIAGHDHVNNYSVLYQGIRLTYGLKTGGACYADEDLNGGTMLVIKDGVMTTTHKYVTQKDIDTLAK